MKQSDFRVSNYEPYFFLGIGILSWVRRFDFLRCTSRAVSTNSTSRSSRNTCEPIFAGTNHHDFRLFCGIPPIRSPTFADPVRVGSIFLSYIFVPFRPNSRVPRTKCGRYDFDLLKNFRVTFKNLRFEKRRRQIFLKRYRRSAALKNNKQNNSDLIRPTDLGHPVRVCTY